MGRTLSEATCDNVTSQPREPKAVYSCSGTITQHHPGWSYDRNSQRLWTTWLEGMLIYDIPWILIIPPHCYKFKDDVHSIHRYNHEHWEIWFYLILSSLAVLSGIMLSDLVTFCSWITMWEGQDISIFISTITWALESGRCISDLLLRSVSWSQELFWHHDQEDRPLIHVIPGSRLETVTYMWCGARQVN